ncbi:hypothetical protein GOP47_0013164 [Adiantum capillus-veneris]|uniref:Uncharacterized protein n=1 Tax=Adiantum capillus-veneris TaxID=13818 RepID=A0A9D4ZCX0_ADICA|nr:hypothetical protein GOP47_0013164 [Adiantum capillus-veneris]
MASMPPRNPINGGFPLVEQLRQLGTTHIQQAQMYEHLPQVTLKAGIAPPVIHHDIRLFSKQLGEGYGIQNVVTPPGEIEKDIPLQPPLNQNNQESDNGPEYSNAQEDEGGTSPEEIGVTIHSKELEQWHSQLQIIRLLHGARPSIEALTTWMAQNWDNNNIKEIKASGQILSSNLQKLGASFKWFTTSHPTGRVELHWVFQKNILIK